MTFAEAFKIAYNKRYEFNLSRFKSAPGPDPLAYRRPEYYCQFHVTFKDGSDVHVIMTGRQRVAINRTSFWDNIKTIGGEGYKQWAYNPCSVL